MIGDSFQIVEALFTEIWRLFNSWHIPGTQMTPAALGLFMLSADIGLRFVGKILDTNSASVGRAVGNAKFIRERVK